MQRVSILVQYRCAGRHTREVRRREMGGRDGWMKGVLEQSWVFCVVLYIYVYNT